MIVSLPGILMQGGKVTWKKYEVSYTEKDGTPVSVSRNYSHSKQVSNSYTRNKKTFTLTSPTSKTLENLTANDLLVNIADSNSTATSGNTLYRINSDATLNWAHSYLTKPIESNVRLPYSTDVGQVGTTLYFVDRYSITKDGKIKLSTPKSVSVYDFLIDDDTGGLEYTTWLSPYPYNQLTTSWSNGLEVDELYEFRHYVFKYPNDLLVDIYYPYTVSKSSVTLNYTPRTVSVSRGAYIEDVQGRPGAYPDDGIMGDYWYVKSKSNTGGINFINSIQSSGTQYINTNFIPNANTRVVIDFEPISVDSTHIFGSRTASSASDYFLPIVTGGVYRDDYGSEKTVTTIKPESRITIDKNKNVTIIGDTIITHSSSSFNGTYPIALFASNSGGTVSYFSTYRLYSCKIYDNDVLVRDYRPCIDSNGVVCLYEAVNDECVYNAGTGNFVDGGVERNVNYVSYIQSNGTQYIDTDYKPNQSTRVVMDAQWVSTPTKDSCLFGARKASGSIDNSLWYVYSSGVLQSGYGNTKKQSSSIEATTRHAYDKNGNILYVDDTAAITNTTATFQSDYNLFLLTCNQAGSAMSNSASIKLYSCKIYDNGVLIRNYKPCLDQDGVACLYDTVNNEYIYHAGTGTLQYGIAEKYNWQRYSVSYTAVEGNKTSVRFKSRKYLRLGETYSIINGQFAVKTTSSIRITQSQTSFTASYSILVDGVLGYDSTQTSEVGNITYGAVLAKLTQITYMSPSDITVFYYPYTIGETKGSYIDTIDSEDPTAYPDNGIKNGYWYVKI